MPVTSYWDINKSGISTGPLGEPKTSEELKQVTDAGGIYAEWTQVCPYDSVTAVWDFGTSMEYPVLQCMPSRIEWMP